MYVRLLVVDNGATETASEALFALVTHPVELHLLREPLSGKSRALNLGLKHQKSDLVAFIDDDERLENDWFEVVEREFSDETIAFIGGPYVPDYQSPRPDWLPAAYPAAIGATDFLAKRTRFASEEGPVLMGGNAVIRSSIQTLAGDFDVDLGPTATQRQRTGEDHDMFLRYLALGAVGWFVPELRIRHFVPSARLAKSHYRSFVSAHGKAQAALDLRRPPYTTRIYGLPRHRLGSLIRALPKFASRSPSTRFQAELHLRETCAFVYEHIRLRAVGRGVF